MHVENKRHTNAHQPLTFFSPIGISIPPLRQIFDVQSGEILYRTLGSELGLYADSLLKTFPKIEVDRICGNIHQSARTKSSLKVFDTQLVRFVCFRSAQGHGKEFSSKKSRALSES